MPKRGETPTGLIDEEVWKAMNNPSLVDDIRKKVSRERIGMELFKMLRRNNRELKDENPAITKDEAIRRLRNEFADDPELAQAKVENVKAGNTSWYVTAKKSEKTVKRTRPKPKWTPVDSTCVKAISYDPESRRLDVKLHDGSQYAYDDVPWQTHKAMMRAKSKGEFFNRIIKKRYNVLLN